MCINFKVFYNFLISTKRKKLLVKIIKSTKYPTVVDHLVSSQSPILRLAGTTGKTSPKIICIHKGGTCPQLVQKLSKYHNNFNID